MIIRNRHIVFLAFLLCLVSFDKIEAQSFDPKEMVNPNIADRRVYVADPAGLVGSAAIQKANGELYDLRLKTGAEVVVAVVPSLGDKTIEEFSEELFTSWGIGKSDKDNGVLVVIAPNEKKVRIATGYGMEGILPDITAKKIIDKTVVPNMREGNLDGAVTAVSTELYSILTNPEYAEEIKSSRGEAWNEAQGDDITTEDLINFALIIAFSLFGVAIVLYVIDSGKSKKKDRYQQALYWHDKKPTYIFLAIGSLGLGLIPLLLVQRKYKRSRNKPIQCPVCNTRMEKLNEEEDNNYLNPSQDFEEKLNTVDYDVWKCPRCSTIEKYPFRTHQKQYEECPRCHTVAMTLVRDHTLTPATTRRVGMGEKVYECKFCHHQDHRRYTIPRKEDGTGAALVAGGILGSMGRGGGSGFGGGMGGGFGGGSTGGGGASGSW